MRWFDFRFVFITVTPRQYAKCDKHKIMKLNSPQKSCYDLIKDFGRFWCCGYDQIVFSDGRRHMSILSLLLWWPNKVGTKPVLITRWENLLFAHHLHIINVRSSDGRILILERKTFTGESIYSWEDLIYCRKDFLNKKYFCDHKPKYVGKVRCK